MDSYTDKYLRRMKRPSRIICGVAAMMADKFNWSCLWTRLVWALVILMNPGMGLLIYFVLALVLPKWETNF
ncbi:PspC domain-containing protein [Shewanella eurypsychrophilus]|uniref:PspC domain-containing protein n=1 Tax=Shewanella eurypsychrophilus TaxID=2593656 RepID=A0ABX6VCM0_9GAMM|nr:MULTISPECIES: PspC domain-containing protein [Shewanella]QFU24453.1 PspC domain-containing protein [Shewanella sp. YLB-09]QPG59653.1 PspC domain-containing protein [Shewanella eurypsychrophilus]